jgi:hypothetical protein
MSNSKTTDTRDIRQIGRHRERERDRQTDRKREKV